MATQKFLKTQRHPRDANTYLVPSQNYQTSCLPCKNEYGWRQKEFHAVSHVVFTVHPLLQYRLMLMQQQHLPPAALPEGPLKQCVQNRLLSDMLKTVRDSCMPSGGWMVLIMDDFASKVMSSALKMSDITDAGERVCVWLEVHTFPYKPIGSFPLILRNSDDMRWCLVPARYHSCMCTKYVHLRMYVSMSHNR